MKKSLITLASVALLSLPLTIKANGFANVTVDGPATTNVNDEIKINVRLTDIKDTLDGIVGFGGDLNYDKDYLQYIGSTKSNETYEFMINESILRIAGVDYTLKNGIKDDTTVYTFNFKVLKEGNTTISFDNAEVVDSDASNVESKTNNLKLTINKAEEVKPVEEIKEEVVVEQKQEEIKEEVKPVVTKEATKEEIAEEKAEETKEEVVVEQKQEETKKTFNDVVKEIFMNIIKSIANIFLRK